MKTKKQVDTKRADSGNRRSAKPSESHLRNDTAADASRRALDTLGFLPNETVQLATKEMGRFKRRAIQVADVDDAILQPQQDLWIGANPITAEGRGFGKDRVSLIRNIVVDVDYNEPGHHKHKPVHDDLDAALRAIARLPLPTFVQHTGGGIQAFWRLSTPLPNDAVEQQRAEALAKKLAIIARADPCQSIEHVFRFPLSLNCKTTPPKQVTELSHSGATYMVDALEAAVSHISTDAEVPVARATAKHDGMDRSAGAFKLIRAMADAGITEERRILSALRKSDFWGHYISENHARQDIRATIKKLADGHGKIELANEVVRDSLDDSALSPELRVMSEHFRRMCYNPERDIERTLSVLDQCHREKLMSMIPARCGQGKTTAMMILAAAYATPTIRFLLVVEKVVDVIRIAKWLTSLGVEATAWHGHPDQPICQLNRKDFIRLKGERRLPCQICKEPCAAKNKYNSSDPFNPPGHVVITTHTWFRAMALKGTLPRFQQLIIDEEPDVFDHLEITDRSIYHLLRCLPPAIQDDCRQWFLEVVNAVGDGGGRRIPAFAGLKDADKGEAAQAHLAMLLSKGEASDEDYALVAAFLQFVQSQRLGQSYGFMEYDTAKRSADRVIWLLTKALDFGALPPTIVLNGSADLSFVRWEGFRIYDQSSFQTNYPKTTIHVTMGNPSQRNLADPLFFSALQESVLAAVARTKTDSVILFTNKDLPRKPRGIEENVSALRAALEERGIELLDLTYGQHRATNEGRDNSGVVICMGLFRKVGWYVVRACAATNAEIAPERIWAEKWESPKMGKGGGFVDPAIQCVYALTAAYDVEQAILRGRIRKDPSLSYLACVVASGHGVISLLETKFPRATFEYDDKWLVESFRAGLAIDVMAAEISRRNKLSRRAAIEKVHQIRRALWSAPR